MSISAFSTNNHHINYFKNNILNNVNPIKLHDITPSPQYIYDNKCHSQFGKLVESIIVREAMYNNHYDVPVHYYNDIVKDTYKMINSRNYSNFSNPHYIAELMVTYPITTDLINHIITFHNSYIAYSRFYNLSLSTYEILDSIWYLAGGRNYLDQTTKDICNNIINGYRSRIGTGYHIESGRRYGTIGISDLVIGPTLLEIKHVRNLNIFAALLQTVMYAALDNNVHFAVLVDTWYGFSYSVDMKYIDKAQLLNYYFLYRNI